MDSYIAPSASVQSPRPPRRSRKGLYVLLAVVLVAVVVLVWKHPWTGDNKIVRGRPPGDQATSVTVARADIGDIQVSVASLGTVTPLTTVTVKSQISGYLMAIDFTEGQEVKKGDVLAQVDDRPYLATLEQFQGNLLRDQALLKNAQLDLSRYQNLSRLDSISRQNVDTQGATVAQYQGAVKTDQGEIDAQKLNIDYARITAPSDGRVGLRQVDVGNYVTPGDTNGLVVLTQLKPISVIFTIPQTELSGVLERLRGGSLPVTAYASDNSTVVGTGSVSTIDNQIDTTTGTVKLRAMFANDDETLFPNQFVNTSLLVRTVRGALTIPNEAVQRGTPGTYVYLVGADNKVSLRKIAVGVAAAGTTQVLSGLERGDAVVLDGTSRLRAGSAVSISNLTAAQLQAQDEAAALKGNAEPPNARRRGRRHGGQAPNGDTPGGQQPQGGRAPAGGARP